MGANMRMVWRIAALVVLLCAAAGCGKDKATGPEPAQIVGAWTATKLEYVSQPPGTTVDLIALGGTASLALNEGGSFVYLVTPQGQSANTTTGTWAPSGDIMNLTPQGMPFSWQFEVAFSGNSLGLSGASVEYDFNHDGTPDQATLNLSLVR